MQIVATVPVVKKAGSPKPRCRRMAKTARGRQRQFELHTTAAAVLKERLEKNARRPKDKRLEERNVLVSPTDPEAAIGRDKEKVLCACYNVQFQVDSPALMIVDYATNAQSTDSGLLEQHLKKMEAPAMKEIFRTRGSIIERSFGDGKEHRNSRRFHCRGRDRSHAEVGLLVLATNLLHLRRVRKSKETESATPG